MCLVSTYSIAIDLPPTTHEYTWLERQEINFKNQQLLVELEPLIAAEKWEEAEEILTEALNNDPYDNKLKGRLLTVYTESGQDQKALDMAYPLLKENPRYAPLIIFIGNLEKKMGNQETSAKAWTYILELPTPTREEKIYAAKSLYYDSLSLNNLESLLESTRIWASLEVSYESNLNFASALWKNGNRDRAIQRLERAVRIASPSEKTEGESHLAYTLLKAGRPEEAKPLFEKFATSSPNPEKRYQASLQLAHIYLNESDPKAARKWLDHAVDDGEKDEEWKKLYSQTLIQGSSPEETLKVFEDVFETDQAIFLTLLSFQFLREGYDGLAYYFIRQADEKEGLPANREADYWANRAYMAEAQDNFQDALDSIDMALAREDRVDWKIIRVRSLFMLGENRSTLDEAEQLEKEVEALPRTPENIRIQNEAINLMANSNLALEEYREVLAISERFKNDYSGSELYRSEALAYFHLGEYENSQEAFLKYFELQPSPTLGALVEYGFLQEKRKEWELATATFTKAIERNPFDLRSWETLTYVLVKAVENSEAIDVAKETIALQSETLPSAEGEERREIEQSIIAYKTLVTDLERTWGFQAFANYNEFIPDGNDVFVTRDSALPAELGGQISYRPPVLGFRDYRTLDLFLRVIGQFDDDTIRPNEDTWQGGLGAEWKPFKTLNYITSLEYLFKIGDDSREGWLWRNRASFAYGDYPREDELWWPTLVLYGEAAWLFDRKWRDEELSLFTEDRLGVSWRIKDNISLTIPQVQGTIRYLVDGYTERSSYYFGGLGANLRYSQGQTEDQTNNWYFDLYLHYNWGRFLDEEANPTGSRFDGWAAGIRFYR